MVLGRLTVIFIAKPTFHLGKHRVTTSSLAYPRYVMESVGMALIALLAYVLSLEVGGISTALPVLGALAIGAQRLLPALQQVYYCWSMIASSQGSLDDIVTLLDQPLPAEKHQSL